MIEPDLDNRQPCCGAPGSSHWIDCPTQESARKAEREARERLLHSLTVVRCRCNLCAAWER